jgi:dTDP-4-amino-4,6-dideoxygalactose transaminase
MKQPIFSSLGVNYSFLFAVLALTDFVRPSGDAQARLRQEIETLFGGRCALVYKGRDAIELALRALKVGEGDQVLTQAFACYAVEEGIVRSGAAPVYVDLERGKSFSGVAELERAYQAAPRAKAVLFQHTFGVPGPTRAQYKWCRSHSLLIIDDLAQALGSTDEAGALVGAQADAVVFSFGRDKIIDAVSGGAVLVREQTAVERLHAFTKALPSPPLGAVVRDAYYPMTTWKIRAFYRFGIGKLIAYCAKRFGLITSPLESATQQPTQLPASAARRALRQWKVLKSQLAHRRMIAAEYYRFMEKELSGIEVPSESDLKRGAWLRVPLQLSNIDAFLKAAQDEEIFLHDRWYRSAVDCSTLTCNSVYTAGSCPNAERFSQSVINLPTHQYISLEDLQRVCAVIKRYSTS